MRMLGTRAGDAEVGVDGVFELERLGRVEEKKDVNLEEVFEKDEDRW